MDKDIPNFLPSPESGDLVLKKHVNKRKRLPKYIPFKTIYEENDFTKLTPRQQIMVIKYREAESNRKTGLFFVPDNTKSLVYAQKCKDKRSVIKNESIAPCVGEQKDSATEENVFSTDDSTNKIEASGNSGQRKVEELDIAKKQSESFQEKKLSTVSYLRETKSTGHLHRDKRMLEYSVLPEIEDQKNRNTDSLKDCIKNIFLPKKTIQRLPGGDLVQKESRMERLNRVEEVVLNSINNKK